mmetsp:Transcript_4285/g.19452  ORF Transcript_4285/g.19452 Transcript_4285/m.19452 type:complete len:288 (-) Transcript_4285:196-1059(-)
MTCSCSIGSLVRAYCTLLRCRHRWNRFSAAATTRPCSSVRFLELAWSAADAFCARSTSRLAVSRRFFNLAMSLFRLSRSSVIRFVYAWSLARVASASSLSAASLVRRSSLVTLRVLCLFSRSCISPYELSGASSTVLRYRSYRRFRSTSSLASSKSARSPSCIRVSSRISISFWSLALISSAAFRSAAVLFASFSWRNLLNRTRDSCSSRSFRLSASSLRLNPCSFSLYSDLRASSVSSVSRINRRFSSRRVVGLTCSSTMVCSTSSLVAGPMSAATHTRHTTTTTT